MGLWENVVRQGFKLYFLNKLVIHPQLNWLNTTTVFVSISFNAHKNEICLNSVAVDSEHLRSVCAGLWDGSVPCFYSHVVKEHERRTTESKKDATNSVTNYFQISFHSKLAYWFYTALTESIYGYVNKHFCHRRAFCNDTEWIQASSHLSRPSSTILSSVCWVFKLLPLKTTYWN